MFEAARPQTVRRKSGLSAIVLAKMRIPVSSEQTSEVSFSKYSEYALVICNLETINATTLHI